MLLTEHFALSEFTKTKYLPSKNIPSEREIERLVMLSQTMEVIRAELGHRPITITSGFRSQMTNYAAGGSKTSNHRTGWACDFSVAGLRHIDVYKAVKQMREMRRISYDQLIGYQSHTHISIAPRNRGESWQES